MTRLQRSIHLLNQLEKGAAATLLGLMTALLIGDVAARQFGMGGSAWVQRAGLMCMIWAAFLGVPLTSAQGRHLRAEFSDRWWSPKLRGTMRALEELVIAVFCLGCSVLAASYCLGSAELGDRDPVLEIPLWTTQVVIPYALASTGVRHLVYFLSPPSRPQRGGPV